MTLKLLSTEGTFSIYEDENGEEILIGAGPGMRRVVFWDHFDLQAAWAALPHWPPPNRETFLETVRLAVTDPDDVNVAWCTGCEQPQRTDDTEDTVDGSVCSDCFEDYRSCDDCGQVVHYESTVYTLSDESVCERCGDNNYSYCEDCDGYYYTDNGGHEHGGCGCESPKQVFAMRNDGEPALNQDERVTIALPSGVISAEGIESIAQLLNRQAYSIEMGDEFDDYDKVYAVRSKWWNLASTMEAALGDQWQTREGNYTKRLSKLAHKSGGLKIPPEMLSQIGCIARDNSTGVDFQVEITRNLNLSAEEFYHEDSCWWQSYSESRCALKTNGGIGMRTFNESGYVQGRAWIMPLRADGDGNLSPTFDSLTPDAFMVFNGYGDLSGYAPARIVAHMAGMTYRKISFECSPMYVNNSSGYLVASEEIASRYAEAGRLSLDVYTHSNLFHKEEARELVAA